MVIKKNTFLWRVNRFFSRIIMFAETWFYNLVSCLKADSASKPIRVLYVCPVGQYGVGFLPDVFRVFRAHADIKTNFLLFNYESIDLSHFISDDCEIIDGPGIKWELARKYVTPEYCKDYDLIFFWDDDIDVCAFSLKRFIDIFRRNRLQMAQPALTGDSYYSHKVTLRDRGRKVGRYTDFVEIMVPVFTREAWSAFYNQIDTDIKWGWGLDDMARSLCAYRNIGIVDAEPVRHTRPTCQYREVALPELARTIEKHRPHKRTFFTNYANLS